MALPLLHNRNNDDDDNNNNGPLFHLFIFCISLKKGAKLFSLDTFFNIAFMINHTSCNVSINGPCSEVAIITETLSSSM